MRSAKIEIQALCGSFNRATKDIGAILDKIRTLPNKVSKIYPEYNKKDIKEITLVNLGLDESCYKTDMLRIISRICYIYDIKAYCRLTLPPGSIEPEKLLYIIGPNLSCIMVSTLIKYLYKCRIKINKSNIGINTIAATKISYFAPILEILYLQEKIKMKNTPLYQRVLKNEMLTLLMFDYTPTYLDTKKHWVKSVKLKKPKFKDKYLI